MKRCDAHGRSKQELAWGSVTVVRWCDRHQGGVKDVRKVCQVMVMGEM